MLWPVYLIEIFYGVKIATSASLIFLSPIRLSQKRNLKVGDGSKYLEETNRQLHVLNYCYLKICSMTVDVKISFI